MYAKNTDYLFVAQQFLERHLLENNVNVAGQKGTVSKGLNGTTKVSCNNAFDIFGKIAGTPQYWKNFRNELFARMEQLGQFTFFFTLSAAEMRWFEVTTAILHVDKNLDKIVYELGWEENISNIKLHFIGTVFNLTQKVAKTLLFYCILTPRPMISNFLILILNNPLSSLQS